MNLDDERAEITAREVWKEKYKIFDKTRAEYDGLMDDFFK